MRAVLEKVKELIVDSDNWGDKVCIGPRIEFVPTDFAPPFVVIVPTAEDRTSLTTARSESDYDVSLVVYAECPEAEWSVMGVEFTEGVMANRELLESLFDRKSRCTDTVPWDFSWVTRHGAIELVETADDQFGENETFVRTITTLSIQEFSGS